MEPLYSVSWLHYLCMSPASKMIYLTIHTVRITNGWITPIFNCKLMDPGPCWKKYAGFTKPWSSYLDKQTGTHRLTHVSVRYGCIYAFLASDYTASQTSSRGGFQTVSNASWLHLVWLFFTVSYPIHPIWKCEQGPGFDKGPRGIWVQ